jgi:hypothetical protein
MLNESFATFHERLIIHHHNSLRQDTNEKEFYSKTSSQFSYEEDTLIYKRIAQQPV